MKAIVFDRCGPAAEVLRLGEAPRPEPGPGQARVRMLRVPINPSDLMFVRGIYGKRPSLPGTPGFEGVGVVDQVGPGWIARVRGLKPGRRVAVPNSRGGNWAEEVVVPARQLVPLPDDIPDDQAATFFVNPLTVLAMVNRVLQVPRGAWLLQTAAASALGRMIIRLGRQQGFRTLNLVRRADAAAELRQIGADAVIDLSTEAAEPAINAVTQGAKVRYAIDCVGGTMGLEAVKALAPGGRLLLYGTLSGEPIPLDPRFLISGQKRIEGFWLSEWVQQQRALTMLGLFRQITRLLKADVLTSPVEATYEMDQIGEAVTHAERPGRHGKILLKIRS